MKIVKGFYDFDFKGDWNGNEIGIEILMLRHPWLCA